jgi:hypothetical protein
MKEDAVPRKRITRREATEWARVHLAALLKELEVAEKERQQIALRRAVTRSLFAMVDSR